MVTTMDVGAVLSSWFLVERGPEVHGCAKRLRVLSALRETRGILMICKKIGMRVLSALDQGVMPSGFGELRRVAEVGVNAERSLIREHEDHVDRLGKSTGVLRCFEKNARIMLITLGEMSVFLRCWTREKSPDDLKRNPTWKKHYLLPSMGGQPDTRIQWQPCIAIIFHIFSALEESLRISNICKAGKSTS